jgi:hypothetical protein
MKERRSLDILRRIIYDLDRLPYHYNVVTLYGLFFQDLLPLISLGCIALGLLMAGYACTDASGMPQSALRRVALAGALSVTGIALYILVPIWLDAQGITPAQGHIRFYGMFFIPVGALAGVLAVMAGSSLRLTPADGKRRLVLFSVAGYAIGFVVMWLVFFLYSRIILGATMIVAFALIRATATAALGGLLFAVAPYLVHVVAERPARRLLAWGYGLLVVGTIALLVAQVTTLVLNLHADVL